MHQPPLARIHGTLQRESGMETCAFSCLRVWQIATCSEPTQGILLSPFSVSTHVAAPDTATGTAPEKEMVLLT
jgi:hypothetical protein